MSSSEHPVNSPKPPETGGGFERAHPNIGFVLFGFLSLGAASLAFSGAPLSALLTFAAGLLFYPPMVRRAATFIADWRVHFALRAAGLLLLLALSVAVRPTPVNEFTPPVMPKKELHQALLPDLPEPEAAPTPNADKPIAATPTPPADLPIYTVLARNVVDTAARGEIALDVLVISHLQREALERLLRFLERQIAQPGALKHRPQLDRLTIAAFTARSIGNRKRNSGSPCWSATGRSRHGCNATKTRSRRSPIIRHIASGWPRKRGAPFIIRSSRRKTRPRALPKSSSPPIRRRSSSRAISSCSRARRRFVIADREKTWRRRT